jgi:hypothetical protein
MRMLYQSRLYCDVAGRILQETSGRLRLSSIAPLLSYPNASALSSPSWNGCSGDGLRDGLIPATPLMLRTLVLAFMAVVLLRLARDEKVTLSAAGLALAADALRDTVQGQFISGVQGASAMQRLRDHHDPSTGSSASPLTASVPASTPRPSPSSKRTARGRDRRAARSGAARRCSR